MRMSYKNIPFFHLHPYTEERKNLRPFKLQLQFNESFQNIRQLSGVFNVLIPLLCEPRMFYGNCG